MERGLLRGGHGSSGAGMERGWDRGCSGRTRQLCASPGSAARDSEGGGGLGFAAGGLHALSGDRGHPRCIPVSSAVEDDAVFEENEEELSEDDGEDEDDGGEEDDDGASEKALAPEWGW